MKQKYILSQVNCSVRFLFPCKLNGVNVYILQNDGNIAPLSNPTGSRNFCREFIIQIQGEGFSKLHLFPITCFGIKIASAQDLRNSEAHLLF